MERGAVHRAALVVGMTTIPSRIGLIRPAIDSLLANSKRPDRIVLSVPRFPLRGNGELVIPPFLQAGEYVDKVAVNILEEDFGPGSKLLGCLGQLEAGDVLVLADDDMEYDPSFLERLFDAQLGHPRESFTFYAYRYKGLTVGQGADGFSFMSEQLGGMREFFETCVRGTDLMFHDDFWISFYLFTKGIRIKGLQHSLGGKLIYRPVHEQEALRALGGSLARDRISASGLQALKRSASLGLGKSARLFLCRIGEDLARLPARARNFLARSGRF